MEANIVAVTAGAVSGLTGAAKKSASDAYSGLKALIEKKFGAKSDVTDAIEKQGQPESPGRQQTPAAPVIPNVVH